MLYVVDATCIDKVGDAMRSTSVAQGND